VSQQLGITYRLPFRRLGDIPGGGFAGVLAAIVILVRADARTAFPAGDAGLSGS
jgi:hypothetical protein